MRKVLSILLSALMTLCVFSVNVMALDETPEELSVKVRYVVNTDPVLTVPSEMTIFKGEKFNPLDVASAKDAEDGNITASIKVDGQFDVDALGSYVLTYSVTDRFGGTDTKTLKLNVIEKLEEGKASAETNVSNDAPVSKVEVDIDADSILNAAVKEEGNKTSNLSPEQKQAIKDGADVNLQLTVNKTTEEASDDSKKIEDAVKSSNNNTFIGALLDINLLCTVISNNTQVGSTSKITETSEAVKISVTVPEELINNDPDVNRSFDVARLHDGIVELLGAVYDKDSKKLSFFSNKFSTYAIVYTDTKVEQSNNTSQSSSSGYKKPVVNTGYGFNVSSIEILGDSASAVLPIDGLPECNVLTVTYKPILELKSADNKIVNANVEFVDKITKNDSYTLTVKLQENAAKPEPGIYEGTVTVSITSEEYEAKIGDTYIKKLSDAITTAQAGDTIKILKDIEVNDQFVIDKKLYLDLNKKTISYAADTVLKSGIVKIVAGGDLTINGEGKISTGDKAYAAIAIYGDGSNNLAKLTIENGEFQGYYYPIAGNGTCHNTEITINDGTFYSTNGLCIYHPQNGTLIINGGSFEGQESAIEIRSGNVVINGGDFTSTASSYSCNANGNGTTTIGAAVAIAQHTTKKDISVTINSGTFNGIKSLSESNPQNNNPAPKVDLNVKGGVFNGDVSVTDSLKFITGGTFSSDPSAYVAGDYTAVKTSENKWIIKDRTYSFSEASEELAFCADCYNNPGTDHSSHKKYLNISNGVAEVKESGAWMAFHNLDWDNKSYTLEYDVDLSNLANDCFVAFDAGEMTTWQDLHIGFKNVSGTIKVYNTIFTNQVSDSNCLGNLNGKNAHLVYRYSMTDNGQNVSPRYVINMNLEVSDGTNTYSVAKSTTNPAISTDTKLCWDVYTVDGESEIYATLDDFLFKAN